MSMWGDRRLLVVTGKGGVGRSAVSAALGVAATQAGRATTTVELDAQGSLAELHGFAERQFEPRTGRDGVDTMSLSVMESLDDFGRRKLKIGALVKVVFRNRIVKALVDGVPGLHDLQQLGKLRNLMAEPLAKDRKYDLAVVDAPATGHGLTLLDAGLAMAELTRVGPLHDEARQVEEWLGDASLTGIVVVTLAERLPVQEALQLIDQLGPKRDQLVAVVLNQTRLDPYGAELAPQLRQATLDADRPDLADLIDRDLAIAKRQAEAVALLDAGLAERGLGHVLRPTLPRLDHSIGAADLPLLAAHLRGTDEVPVG